MELIEKACLHCGRALKGRSDKKFCNDYCRNCYNNQFKMHDSAFMRKVNSILRNNRRILYRLMGNDKTIMKIRREQLLSLGFIFRYFTETYRNKKGNSYFFCYEYGYYNLNRNWILLIKKPELTMAF